MALEFFEASVSSPSGASAGIFLPIADLPGVVGGEFANANATELKTGKAVAAILNQVYDILSPTAFDKLGFSVTKGNFTGTATDQASVTYTMTCQFLSSLKDDSTGQIPVPGTGANSGVGDFALSDIFAAAEIVAADGAISGEGVLIPFADVNEYGSPASIADISSGQDNRGFLAALYLWMVDNLDVRATGTISAVLTKTLGAATGVTLAAAATDATDPTTGIDAADLLKVSVYSRLASITIEYIFNHSSQSFDVNVA